MLLTRRKVLTGATGLAAAAALPMRSWAQTTMTLHDGAELITISDGALTFPEAFIIGDMPAEEARAILRAAGENGPEYKPACNVTLLRRGDEVVLFDTGAGPDFMASAGELPDALAAAQIDPGDITKVVFTHAHPDHLWGVLDDFDEPMFYNAHHMMGAAELAYWADPDTANTIGEMRQSFAAGARRRLGLMDRLIEPFEAGDQVAPGVEALLLPGHTPGHMGFIIDAGAQAAMIIGDAVGNHHLGFVRPEWQAPADQQGALAAATRVALLDRLAADDMTVIGYHLPDGGIGKVARDGTGFVYIPA